MPQTVIPQLRMRDAAVSLPFYVDGLGFKIDWEHRFGPDYPLFVQLTRAGQTLFLSEHEGDAKVGGAVYFLVPDVNDCHRRFEANTVPINQPPYDTPWRTREMVVVDPDGNRLRFATDPDLPNEA